MANGNHKRKLSNYLLDKRLQLRYVAFVSLLSAIIACSLGYLIYQQEARASATVSVLLEEADYGSDVQAMVRDRMASGDQNLVLRMAAVGCGLVLILSLFLVVMTHKVAGPLYKVTLYFDKMASGYLGTVWPLRKGDMLKDFYDKFQAMHGAVRSRHQATNEVIGRFLEAAEAAGVSREGELGHELDELEAHHQQREKALA